MDHYYSSDPKSISQTRTIEFTVAGTRLRFLSDRGVFSRQQVDYGSSLLIETLPPLAGQVLDLGCGYGPIGISLAKLNPNATVTMVDINKRATELTQTNIVENEIANARVLTSDGFSNLQGYFDHIVSNPPIRAGKQVIYALFAQSRHYLHADGHLWLVIQKKQGAASAMKYLTAVFGNCQAIDKVRGYWVLRSSLK